MNTGPVVSVIIIFFNTEKYIREAIESVLLQTYGNWELLLVDDGSVDGSTDIALEYVNKFPEKIKYLEHPDHENRGMSASRNLGIYNSQGEYISFLDSDDLWFPYTLSEQVEILNSHPNIDMAYGLLENFYDGGVDSNNNIRDLIQPKSNEFVKPNSIIEPPLLAELYLSGNQYLLPGMCSMCIRKSTLYSVGGFVDSFTGLFEDHVLKIKICLKHSVYFTGSCWSKYRRHIEASTQKSRKLGEKVYAKLIFLHWLEIYMKSIELNNSKLKKLLHQSIQETKEKLLTRELNNKKKVEELKMKLKLEKEKFKELKLDKKEEIAELKNQTKKLNEKIRYLRSKADTTSRSQMSKTDNNTITEKIYNVLMYIKRILPMK